MFDFLFGDDSIFDLDGSGALDPVEEAVEYLIIDECTTPEEYDEEDE